MLALHHWKYLSGRLGGLDFSNGNGQWIWEESVKCDGVLSCT